MPKKKKATEKEIDELFVIVKGFNDRDGQRFEPGTDDKPEFVRAKDFHPEDWEFFVDAGAVVVFEKDELLPGETIAAEIIK